MSSFIGTIAPRDRRAMLVGIVAIASMLVAFKVIPAVNAWRSDLSNRTVEALTRAAELDSVVATFDEAMDTLEARTRRIDQQAGLFSGETPEVAGANLAALLSQLARDASVRLDALEVHADTSISASLPKLTLQVQATTDVVGLAALIAGFERRSEVIAIRQLTIRPGNPDAAGDVVETLSIRMTLEAVAQVNEVRP